ncbi:MAG: flagellar motor protein MotB [bacterium]
MAKKKKGGGEHGEGLETAGGLRWLITYADMITLLLGVFIILVSTSQMEGPKSAALGEALERIFSIFKREGGDKANAPQSGGDSVLPKRTAEEGIRATAVIRTAIIKKRLVQSIPQTVAEGKIVTEKTKKGLVVSYHDSLFFDVGRANIKEESYASLDKIARTLEIIPNKVIIEGHTDASPISTQEFKSNWELSTARANNILHYFIEHAKKSGFDEEKLEEYEQRFAIAGYGQFQPIDENPSSPQNRRINIVILDKKTKEF